MSVWGLDVRCVDCGVDLMPDTPPGSQDWERYMVHDGVWAAAGMRPNGGWLCTGCLQIRLGRPLHSSDLTDCELNRPGRDDDTPRLAAVKLAADIARSQNASLHSRLATIRVERSLAYWQAGS